MSVEVCPPSIRRNNWRFNRKISQQTEEIVMQNRPISESPSTAKCATVFGQLGVLSGKSRFRYEAAHSRGHTWGHARGAGMTR